MSAQWVDIGGGRKRLVRPKLPDEGRVNPNRSPLYDPPEFFVKASVAHVARTLPFRKDENGDPVVKGADGYTKEGFPIVESQRTVDRIKSMNPELGLAYGDDAVEPQIEQMLKEVPE